MLIRKTTINNVIVYVEICAVGVICVGLMRDAGAHILFLPRPPTPARFVTL